MGRYPPGPREWGSIPPLCDQAHPDTFLGAQSHFTPHGGHLGSARRRQRPPVVGRAASSFSKPVLWDHSLTLGRTGLLPLVPQLSATHPLTMILVYPTVKWATDCPPCLCEGEHVRGSPTLAHGGSASCFTSGDGLPMGRSHTRTPGSSPWNEPHPLWPRHCQPSLGRFLWSVDSHGAHPLGRSLCWRPGRQEGEGERQVGGTRRVGGTEQVRRDREDGGRQGRWGAQDGSGGTGRVRGERWVRWTGWVRGTGQVRGAGQGRGWRAGWGLRDRPHLS